MQVNIPMLREDIKATAAQISALKAVMRESGQPRVTARTYWEIAALKEQATLLCALRAHVRGRLHRPGIWDAAQQAALVEPLLGKYELAEPAQAA